MSFFVPLLWIRWHDIFSLSLTICIFFIKGINKDMNNIFGLYPTVENQLFYFTHRWELQVHQCNKRKDCSCIFLKYFIYADFDGIFQCMSLMFTVSKIFSFIRLLQINRHFIMKLVIKASYTNKRLLKITNWTFIWAPLYRLNYWFM